MTVRIVAAVLRAKCNGSRLEQVLDALSPVRFRSNDLLVGHARGTVHSERGKHAQARKEQRAMRHGEEQILERAVDAARRIVGSRSADCDAEECALAGESAFAIAITIAGVAISVGQAVGPDTIEPTFQDGRHAVPPQRKVKDQGVRTHDLVLLGFDIDSLPAARIRMRRFAHEVEPRRIGASRKIVLVEDGLPAHGIQIRRQHFMSLSAQGVHRNVHELPRQGRRLRMRKDDQHRSAHRFTPRMTAPLAVLSGVEPHL